VGRVWGARKKVAEKGGKCLKVKGNKAVPTKQGCNIWGGRITGGGERRQPFSRDGGGVGIKGGGVCPKESLEMGLKLAGGGQRKIQYRSEKTLKKRW